MSALRNPLLSHYPIKAEAKYSLQDPYADRVVFAGGFSVGSGSILVDGSKYNSHGTIVGATWTPGLHSICLDFDSAIPSYVEIPASHTQLNFTSEDFSIIARIRFDVISNAPYIFHRGAYQADGYMFEVEATGNLLFRSYQTGALQSVNSPHGVITIATWYTLGFSRSGTSGLICIDGADTTVGTPNLTDPATCSRSAKIGIYDNKSISPLDGKMEFLRVFGDIALSESDHLAWHNALK